MPMRQKESVFPLSSSVRVSRQKLKGLIRPRCLNEINLNKSLPVILIFRNSDLLDKGTTSRG